MIILFVSWITLCAKTMKKLNTLNHANIRVDIYTSAGVVNSFDWNGLCCNRNIWEWSTIFDWFQTEHQHPFVYWVFDVFKACNHQIWNVQLQEYGRTLLSRKLLQIVLLHTHKNMFTISHKMQMRCIISFWDVN